MPYQHLQRKTIRLQGYDYSQDGLYFITICCKNRICLFGNIANAQMIYTDAGKTAQQCWLQIPNHFPQIVLHEYVVMPNHVHGIIEIAGAKNLSPTIHMPTYGVNDDSPLQTPFRSPSQTVGSVVRGFKIGVTKWVRKNSPYMDIWQRNYYEHIIRNESSYNNIVNYIRNNPAQWTGDKFYK